MKHINVSLGFHFINLNIDKYNTVLSFEHVVKFCSMTTQIKTLQQQFCIVSTIYFTVLLQMKFESF